jgi:hypothetical protein
MPIMETPDPDKVVTATRPDTDPDAVLADDVGPSPEDPDEHIDTMGRRILSPTVMVRHDGPVDVRPVPSRWGPTFSHPLTTQFTHVIGSDLDRTRLTLIGSVDWLLSRTGRTGSGVPIPADVPLVLTHCDEIWAAVPTSTGDLAVIAEQTVSVPGR